VSHFSSKITGAFALAVTAQAAIAAETAPVVLEPSSQWNLDYSHDSCRLGRKFGEGAQQMFFYVERFEPGDSFFMVLAGQPLGDSPDRKTAFRFGPGGANEFEERGFNGKYGEYGPALMVNGAALMTLPEDEASKANIERLRKVGDIDVFGQLLTAEQERSVEWLDVRASRKQYLRLKLGPMDKPLAAMRGCTDELLTHWGLDLAAIRGMTRAPIPASNPGGWVLSSDYPNGILRDGKQGLVHFRLMVGADGKPSSCHVQQVTTSAEFAEAACRGLMKRAKFEPALGADGKPIASYWRTTVNFQMGW